MKNNFLKNKKAEMEEVVKVALWVLVAIGLGAGIYFLAQKLGGLI